MMQQNALAETVGAYPKVVIVDDDDGFRDILGINLGEEGFDVLAFANGEDALSYFENAGHADIILLDWKMPGLTGLEVLRRIRGQGIEIPVVFLTVMSEEIYEEAALAGGAVDFVDKGRSLSIILKRMRLILDGSKGDAPGDEDNKETVLRIGDLELRNDISRASWKGQRVGLTVSEYNIVALLATKRGEDVSYRQIYDLVRGQDFAAGYGPEGFRTNVRSFIKRIRGKFREIDENFEQIENYPGFGYRWVAER